MISKSLQPAWLHISSPNTLRDPDIISGTNQALQAKIKLASEEEGKAAARARKKAKQKEAFEAELAALSIPRGSENRQALGAAATVEVVELEDDDRRRHQADLPIGAAVEVRFERGDCLSQVPSSSQSEVRSNFNRVSQLVDM